MTRSVGISTLNPFVREPRADNNNATMSRANCHRACGVILFCVGLPLACDPAATKPSAKSPAEAQPSSQQSGPPSGIMSSSSKPPTASVPLSKLGPCEGTNLNLLDVIANTACRIREDEADRMRAAFESEKSNPVRVESTVRPDGAIRVRITNQGNQTLNVPLLLHSELDTFRVTADGKPLVQADVPWPEGFHFDIGRMLVRLTLDPNGWAEALVRVRPTLVATEPGNCPPDAKCAPKISPTGELPAGKYRMAIRPPIYSSRDGLEGTFLFVLK